MIHYHGTPISGKKTDASEFLVGRHALISYEYQRDIDIVAEVCQSFILDNGAFTKWKKGGKVDIGGYIEWVGKYSKYPNFDWCLIPDVIDGNEKQNMELVEMWQMYGSGKGVPVWHMHESWDYLEFLMDEFDTVAIGSSGQWATPGTKKWWTRMDQVMIRCCDVDGFAKVKFHGLRMLDPEVFQNIPLSSADSTNAGVNAGSINRFGSYIPVSAGQRAQVIANRIEQYTSAKRYDCTRLAQVSLFDDF